MGKKKASPQLLVSRTEAMPVRLCVEEEREWSNREVHKPLIGSTQRGVQDVGT